MMMMLTTMMTTTTTATVHDSDMLTYMMIFIITIKENLSALKGMGMGSGSDHHHCNPRERCHR